MDRQPAARSPYRLQFSISQLLVMMTLLAVVLGSLRWATLPVAFLIVMQLAVALLAWTRSSVLISVMTLVIGSLGVLWMAALLTFLLPPHLS